MRFSANLGMLFTDRPLPDAIRAAAGAGFDAVECHFPYAFPEAEIRAALDETGLPMVSLNTRPGGDGMFGLAALPDRRDEARAAVDEAVAYAAAVGAAKVHVMAGITDGGAAAQAAYAETLRHASDMAGRHGIGLLIEPINPRNVPGYHLNSVEQAAEIIDTLALPNLQLMFDCYHVQIISGDLITRLRRNISIIGHVQIAAVPDRGEPDAGEVSYPGVIAALEDLVYQNPIGAEYHPRSGDTEAGLGWLEAFREGRS